MSPKRLGWLAIVYAGLQWPLFLQVQGLALELVLKQRLTGGWIGAIQTLAWLVLLTGGIGLVCVKPWGRWMVVAASATTIVMLLVLLAMASAHGAREAFAPWPLAGLAALGLLPAIFVFAAGLRLPGQGFHVPPAQADVARSIDVRRLDRAYGLFAFTALMVGAHGRRRISRWTPAPARPSGCCSACRCSSPR